VEDSRRRSEKALWIGVTATAIGAVLFPRLEAVKNEDVAIWDLDSEAVVLAPAIIILTLALFGFLGRWTWRDTSGANRPAKVAAVAAPLGLVGVLAFFLSVPIILGGFSVTLGLEGRRRAAEEGKGTRAVIGVVVGAIAFVIGAAIWLIA
jgi:hypothetical protein